MPSPAAAFPDPRDFPAAPTTDVRVAAWYALVRDLLHAETAAPRDILDARLSAELERAWRINPELTEQAIERAPSVDIARHLWRTVDSAWDRADHGSPGDLHVTLFAIPMVIVTGATSAKETVVEGELTSPEDVVDMLRAGHALGGSEAIALSPVLVPATRLGIAHLPQWHTVRELPAAEGPPEAGASGQLFEPAPIRVQPGVEQAHLRFLIGTAMAARGRDLLANASLERWAADLSRVVSRQLSTTGVSVLALPRAPARPLPAQHQGLVAQREVAAQLFATNAIRRFRASVGEPSAVISSHRAPDARGGGELRLSLSSPFDTRDAEGFRCPLQPIEAVGTPLSMLVDLLHDCRVNDIRLLAGIHPDRVPGSGMPLFFRADAVPDDALLQ